MKRSSVASEPISIVCTDREKQKAHNVDEWGSNIEKEGIQVFLKVYQELKKEREISAKLIVMLKSLNHQFELIDDDFGT